MWLHGLVQQGLERFAAIGGEAYIHWIIYFNQSLFFKVLLANPCKDKNIIHSAREILFFVMWRFAKCVAAKWETISYLQSPSANMSGAALEVSFIGGSIGPCQNTLTMALRAQPLSLVPVSSGCGWTSIHCENVCILWLVYIMLSLLPQKYWWKSVHFWFWSKIWISD